MLSWFVLCHEAKNEHKNKTPNARNAVALCEAGYEVVKKLVYPPRAPGYEVIEKLVSPAARPAMKLQKNQLTKNHPP